MKEPSIYTREMYELGYSRKSWKSSRRLLARCIREGKPGLILDIGCGLGFFVECCYKFGVPCIGLEGSEYAVQAGVTRLLSISAKKLRKTFCVNLTVS
jgi:SAM-dependent methyltransferase